ncbi:PREDICTED: uncharacterized protein LOC106805679 [Priapulus caudatus]|uniref:Uncharacterized protein LOC106805679 n=1 Tax=Priapulus caudatus TaxID=37621 RepID=A0ABM1DSD3_PRICU|nr:PREDICTED: uncharacterized protein LOC106805679 [Priapulus caudatus]
MSPRSTSAKTRNFIRSGSTFGPVCPGTQSDILALIGRRTADDKDVVYVTVDTRETGEWTTQVYSARKPAEQNLEAILIEGAVFYRAVRDIGVGEELLVWYSEDVARLIGMPDLPIIQSKDGTAFVCPFCGQSFGYAYTLRTHAYFYCSKLREGVLAENAQNHVTEKPCSDSARDVDRESDRTFLANFPVIGKRTEKVGGGKEKEKNKEKEKEKEKGFRKFVKSDGNKTSSLSSAASSPIDVVGNRKRRCDDAVIDFSRQKCTRLIAADAEGKPRDVFSASSVAITVASHHHGKPTDFNDNSLPRKTDDVSGGGANSVSAFKQVERTSPQTTVPSPSLPDIVYPVQKTSPYPYARLSVTMSSVVDPIPIISTQSAMLPQATSKLVGGAFAAHKSSSSVSSSSYLAGFGAAEPILRSPFLPNPDAIGKLPVSCDIRPFMPAPVHGDVWGLGPYAPQRLPCAAKPYASPMDSFAARRALQAWLPPNVAALTFQAQNWCAKCNTSFRMTSDLVYHMRSHHKGVGDPGKQKREEKLKCGICGDTFRERHHMSRHMTSHM